MVAVISAGRKDQGSSFKALQTYLTLEVDPVTQERVLRGDVLMSSNLLSLETAHAEMKAAAAQNRRADDPIMHYQLAWQHGEQPSPEQWHAAALKTLDALGFKEHQYVCVSHDDRAHFHAHVMVNRIHPHTYRALTPFYSQFTLHKTMRELEHEQGWNQSPGLFRWDEKTQAAVRNTRDEMRKISAQFKGVAPGVEASSPTLGRAAKLEHFNDAESLGSYVKREPATCLKDLLKRDHVTWENVHTLLYDTGLQLDKAERGGYTVRAIGGDIRVKASDVFRFAFSGKASRDATERKLGEWQELATDKPRIVPKQHYTGAPHREPEGRAERRAERAADRAALKADYVRYKQTASIALKENIAHGRVLRSKLFTDLKKEKKRVRGLKAPAIVKRAMSSHLAAEHVMHGHTLTAQLMAERVTLMPSSYKMWVTRTASEGDKRAAAQMRGWRYQDVRNLKDTGREDAIGSLASGALDLKPYWSDLENERLKRLRDHTELAKLLKSVTWKADQRTGNVRYSINHQIALIDRGSSISLANSGESSTLLGLEMAVTKFGHSITANGSKEWQTNLVDVAVKYHINVVFTDPELQRYNAELQFPGGVEAARRKKDALELDKIGDSLKQYSVSADRGQVIQLQHREAEFLMNAACNPNGVGQGGSDLLNAYAGSIASGKERTQFIYGLGDLTISRAHDGQLNYVVAPDPSRLKTVVAHLMSASNMAHNQARLLRQPPTQSRAQEHSGSKDHDRGR
jgi:hypothetical protein